MITRVLSLLIILPLGICLVALGLILRTTAPPFYCSFFEVIGIAFIAVALTAPFSEYFQFRTLSSHMHLVQVSQQAGIMDIFRSRVIDQERFNEALEAVVGKARDLRLAGIAFPKILQTPPYPDPIKNVIYDPGTKLKVLLLDPVGRAAQERAKIEVGRTTIRHIDSTIEQLGNILRVRAARLNLTKAELMKDLAVLGIEVHVYDFDPIAFMIITNDCLFLEQYHFGRLPSAFDGECIGGLMPVLLFNSGSTAFQVMERHFHHIWRNRSSSITERIAAEALSPLPNTGVQPAG
jgi:hypothetical protein